MATRYDDAITFTGPVTFTGSVTTTPSSPASASFMVKRWVSGAITQANLVGAQASQSVAVPGTFPTNVVPLGAYLVTTADTTSSSGDTTSLTASLGVSGSTQGYLAAGLNLIGAGAGRRMNLAGTILGGFRGVDSLLLTLTATGGSPDLADISALAIRVVVLYVEVSAET
ncbi:hypothetical protein OV203_26155 [Nannocystis sp. ILAH1]|uniref:hypothetical protein n=1 Tax=Nannocystis sp. ILAH1 TaxID=2996789 RepID=UPI0022704E24|nr:hypothetical protein [Nannocystis sp. ILAH1]MCY0990654.1 hypothetical protein [Nannocystis sp. ILAH1]